MNSIIILYLAITSPINGTVEYQRVNDKVYNTMLECRIDKSANYRDDSAFKFFCKKEN